MADENTKIIEESQAEIAETPPFASPEPLAEAGVSLSGEAEIPNATPPSSGHLPLAGEDNTETKTEEVPVVGEAKPLPDTVEPSIQDEVVKVEEKPVELIQEKIQTPSAPLSGEAEKEDPEIQTPSAPLSGGTNTNAPQIIQPSPLEALGAAFMANMKRARELLVKARAALSLKREKKIEKIMTLFLKKNKIVNKDVRELLHITEHTSTNYLNVLVKEGKIKREGKGNHSYYTKV